MPEQIECENTVVSVRTEQAGGVYTWAMRK